MATYQIKSGDTLSKIAKQYNTTVQALAAANKIADPNKIQAGATLNIPGTAPVLGPSLPPSTTSPTTPSRFSLSSKPGLLSQSGDFGNTAQSSQQFQQSGIAKTPGGVPAFDYSKQPQQGTQFMQANSSPTFAVPDKVASGSLQGSMSNNTGVTGKTSTSNISSLPTGNNISKSFATQNPVVQPQGNATGSVTGQTQLNQSQFANVIDSMRSKLAYNNDLINARQLLVTKLYDHPLTEQEIAKLPQNFQDIARSGDNRQVEMRIRLLNDEIQGRTNTMDQSIEYLTTAYKDDLNRAEEQKQQALNTVLGFVESYGDQAGEAIKAMYGEDYLAQLESYGINVGGLGGLPQSLQQIKDANAGADNGFTPYQTFTATQALKKNTQTMTAASQELQRQTGIINDTWNRLASGEAHDLNGTSQAIITTFNKILDPTSVVRESEYDRTGSGQALLSNIYGKIASITQGGAGLTRESLKELVDLSNLYAQNAQASIDAKNAAAREEAEFFGLNPDFVTSGDSSGYQNSSSGGVTDIKSIAEAIAKVESGGNYKAIGPVVTSGMYKGDKAYGKYQIMGLNIPEWTKEATGTSYTKEQFLNDQDLQDYTAMFKMEQYYNKYGNADDVFSAWFTGQPVSAANANSKDVTGTTNKQYVSMAGNALRG